MNTTQPRKYSMEGERRHIISRNLAPFEIWVAKNNEPLSNAAHGLTLKKWKCLTSPLRVEEQEGNGPLTCGWGGGQWKCADIKSRVNYKCSMQSPFLPDGAPPAISPILPADFLSLSIAELPFLDFALLNDAVYFDVASSSPHRKKLPFKMTC